ncbi:MAG: zinc ribbon domain-containing protein [Thermanaerothrix sp.]|nr:zinc ribbon domain-containing protein [Thermanaerothrix sp.]
MLCGNCGYNNSASAKFCILCGSQLSKGEIMDPDPKICPQCGEPNEGHAMFCSACRSDVSAAPRRSVLGGAKIEQRHDEAAGGLETDEQEGFQLEEQDHGADPGDTPVQDLSEHEPGLSPPMEEPPLEPLVQEDPPSQPSASQPQGVEPEGEEERGSGKRLGFLPLPKVPIPKLSLNFNFNSRLLMKSLIRIAIMIVIASIGVSIGLVSIMVIKGR